MSTSPTRKIIHIDMDAFFASVEQLDNPELRGKPVAVGGSAERGVVAAASYEARKYGVKSAMPSKTAARKCPQLLFVRPRFERYKEVSNQIRAIFLDYTELVEPLSLDEAYLDVTDYPDKTATEIAQEIRKKIKERTQLTASAGVSYNKFLAKTASDVNKPDGIFVIKPHQAQAFIDQLPIRRFYGIGKVTAEKLERMGIKNGLDLRSKDLDFLVNNFGKAGRYYYGICRGIDPREVNPERIRKSVGVENTYNDDLYEPHALKQAVSELLTQLSKRLEKAGAEGKTMTLKVKYNDFTQITRSKSSSNIYDATSRENAIMELLEALLPTEKGVRLLGVTLSNLIVEEGQLKLPF